MGPSFPADGWPRHVTWVGRWRLPQTVRAGSAILHLQPPLLRSPSASRTNTSFFGSSPFSSASLPWDAGASSDRRFFTAAPKVPCLPAVYQEGGGGYPRRSHPGPCPSFSPIWVDLRPRRRYCWRERDDLPYVAFSFWGAPLRVGSLTFDHLE